VTEQSQDRGHLIADVEQKHTEVADHIKQLKEQHESTGRRRDSEEHELLWRQRHEKLWESLQGLTLGLALLGAGTLRGAPPDAASPRLSQQPQTVLVMDNPMDNPLHRALLNPFGDYKQLEAARQSTNVRASLDESGELSILYKDSEGKGIYTVHVGNVVDVLANAGKELLPRMSAEFSFRVGNDLLEVTVTLHIGFLTRRRKYRLKSKETSYTKDKYKSTDIYTQPDPVRLLDR
jgi:hypothetical protein